MSDESFRTLESACEALVRSAAETAMRRLGDLADISFKHDASVVTDVDQSLQDDIVGFIRREYPGHAIIAEEKLNAFGDIPPPTDAEYCWVIDPLDGTRNFVWQFPSFGTSIGVLRRGVPVAGAVGDHPLRRIYTASLGGGAKLNDKPLTETTFADEDEIVVGATFSRDPLTRRFIQGYLDTPGTVLRNTGSSAAHLGLVACGALAAAFSKKCKIWDVAAGALLVSETGGVVLDEAGENRIPFQLDRDHSRDLSTLACAESVERRLLAMMGVERG